MSYENGLSPGDRAALQDDLAAVASLTEILRPSGIKGVRFPCPACSEDHYLEWELLMSFLIEVLENDTLGPHEPAFDPDPAEYVSWDYALGFLDGFDVYEQISDAVPRRVVTQMHPSRRRTRPPSTP